MLTYREQSSGKNCAVEVGSRPYESVANWSIWEQPERSKLH